MIFTISSHKSLKHCETKTNTDTHTHTQAHTNIHTHTKAHTNIHTHTKAHTNLITYTRTHTQAQTNKLICAHNHKSIITTNLTFCVSLNIFSF